MNNENIKRESLMFVEKFFCGLEFYLPLSCIFNFLQGMAQPIHHIIFLV